MTLGTRVGLAVIGLFVGVLVVYYGFVMPTDPAPAEIEIAAAEPVPSESIEAPAIHERTLEEAPAPKLEPALPIQRPALEPVKTRTPSRETLTAVNPTVPASEPAAPGAAPAPYTAPRVEPETKPTPRPRPEDVPPRPRYEKYTVVEDDTMSSIAEMWFGEAAKWDLVAKANPSVDPAKLKIGQKLRLPAKASERGERNVVVVAGKYVVRPGDTLSSIAFALFRDRGAWESLYDANRRLIGDDPDALVVGMELVVPRRP